MSNTRSTVLKREVGLWGAIMMGLGSIIGTGVFVSIGIATDVAGPAVILAVVIAALVAICNGLSSAQLAANHAVSGGTYEYGYKYLNSWLGLVACLFLAFWVDWQIWLIGLGLLLLGLIWHLVAQRLNRQPSSPR